MPPKPSAWIGGDISKILDLAPPPSRENKQFGKEVVQRPREAEEPFPALTEDRGVLVAGGTTTTTTQPLRLSGAAFPGRRRDLICTASWSRKNLSAGAPGGSRSCRDSELRVMYVDWRGRWCLLMVMSVRYQTGAGAASVIGSFRSSPCNHPIASSTRRMPNLEVDAIPLKRVARSIFKLQEPNQQGLY